MDSSSSSEKIFTNIRSVFTSLNVKLEKSVREHLRAVYGMIALGLVVATSAAIFQVITNFFTSSLFTSLASFILMAFMLMTPHTPGNTRKRLMYFIAFAATTGINTGPLLQSALNVDQSIVMTAFLSSALIFCCFTLAALHAPSTKYLYLEGVISSALLILLMSALFSSSAVMHTFFLWVSLGVNCALVLYDTQLICEKRRRGDDDYIWHSVELFIDFIHLLRYLIAILTEKKESRNRK